ncbi:L-histidine N(alpha)-methyltransferase [Salipaludibacillus sp. CF4.18]|uniref:L-histidine N(alpha)-methyltransferase n=1 Tax=Salipaludibacillus sp. CF4.18 TaxID=3373081 RepID=UPI003EE59163
MKQTMSPIRDLKPSLASLEEDVMSGLKKDQKSLPPKLFYDAEGSRLFNQITELPEYYLTRAEKEILITHQNDIATFIGSSSTLVELGCGNEEKISLILSGLENVSEYIPVDISLSALQETADKIKNDNPLLSVQGIRADYTESLSFLSGISQNKKVISFLGSTLGNFEAEPRELFLNQLAQELRLEDGLLIGIDLKKPKRILEATYNDSNGITARFNKNVLQRINKELDANFQLNNFSHLACYNEEDQRIEMYLVSERIQTVEICGESFHFQKGERIHTENSYKFSVDEFEKTLHQIGLRLRKVWTDQKNHFAVTYVEPLNV